MTRGMPVNRNLIIDLGMSEGNDTAFYLAKGFDVVGVEADPVMHEGLAARFKEQIAVGRLHLLHRAATSTNGNVVSFWHNTHRQGHSSLSRRGLTADITEFKVTTINWPALRAVAGVPYYLKIDIEGGEGAFLRSMVGDADLPAYISAEVHSFEPVDLFLRLGYRQFRLINQTIWHEITLPDPPREGAFVRLADFDHWSGPFGRELPGDRWFGFEEIRALHGMILALQAYGTVVSGWWDCHARRDGASGGRPNGYPAFIRRTIDVVECPTSRSISFTSPPAARTMSAPTTWSIV